jgi:hypothetical protein
MLWAKPGESLAGPSGDPSGADAIRHIDYAFRVDRTFNGRGRVALSRIGGTVLRHDHILPVAPGDCGYTGAWTLGRVARPESVILAIVAMSAAR